MEGRKCRWRVPSEQRKEKRREEIAQTVQQLQIDGFAWITWLV